MAPLAERADAVNHRRGGDGATRQRLLAAAAASCVERGFEAATLGDIARRAHVSAPAIYNHFASKDDLMVAAGRWALDRLRPADARAGAFSIVRSFLSEDFTDSRRLLAELHLAGPRHPRLGRLLDEWHEDHRAAWRRRMPQDSTDPRAADPTAATDAFFTFLLGLCQVDSLVKSRGGREALVGQAELFVHAVLPEEVH